MGEGLNNIPICSHTHLKSFRHVAFATCASTLGSGGTRNTAERTTSAEYIAIEGYDALKDPVP